MNRKDIDMKYLAAYRFSLLLTVVLSFFASLYLLAWLASLISKQGIGLFAWTAIILFALTAINCTLRKRLISWRVRPYAAG